MPDLPSSLALGDIGGVISASPHDSNYSAIQVAVNALISALGGGSTNQFLQATDSDTVAWAGAYTAYVPVWASTGTAVALGNGTITGSYIQLGKLVHGRVTLTFGSTTTFGTGTYTLTLPVAATGATLTPVGTVAALDTGVATYIGSAQWTSGSTVQITNLAVPIAGYTSAVPFTFASGDVIIMNFTYQAS